MKRVRNPLAWTIAAAAVLALSGCGDGGAERPTLCSSDSECPDGARCDREIARCVEDTSTPPPDAGTVEPDAGVQERDAGEQPQPDFEITLSPTSHAVDQGGSVLVTVTLVRSGGFEGPVTVALREPPAGITAQPVQIGPQEASGTLMIEVGFSASPGAVVLQVAGTGGTRVRTVPFSLSVKPVVVAVDITSPASDLHTNGTVAIQLVVSGAQPDEVQLLRDGAVLAVLTPPYQYGWDTRNEVEGEHTISARAIIGGQAFGGPTRRVWVDRIPPAITSRTPAAGAPNLEVTRTFSATFSEPLRPDSVTDQSILVARGSATVNKSLNLSSDGRTLTITATEAPVPPATYTITFNGVTDLAGNPLASSAWSFTFPAWLPVGPPLSATPGATRARAPQLRLDPSGMPVVAWIESDGTSDNGYVSRWNGTAWQQLGTLNGFAAAGTHVNMLVMSLDSSGNPVVAWSESSPSGVQPPSQLFVQRWTQSGWSAMTTGLPSFGTSPRVEDLTATGMGDLLMMVTDFPATSVHRWSNGAWTTLLADDGPLYPPGAFICHQGSLIGSSVGTIATARNCFWESSNGTGGGSMVVVWQRIASTGVWQRVGGPFSASPACHVGSPRIRIDASHRPLVSWHEHCGSSASAKAVHVARFEGLNWNHLGTLANWNGGDAQNADLELHVNGTPIVAWDGVILADRQIGVSHSNGTAWTAIGSGLSASSALNTPGTQPSLELDANGLVYVAFGEAVGSGGDIHVSRQNR